jgi:Flp pilus assembly protein TadD
MKSLERIRSYQVVFVAIMSCLLAGSLTVRGQVVGANRGERSSGGGSRTIKGQVYLPAGDMKNKKFKIRLENVDVGVMTAVSDLDGNFSFNGLAAGSYSLTVEETGEYEGAHENIFMDQYGGGPVVIVPIYLRLKPSADPALAGVPKTALDAYAKGMEAARKGESKKAIEHLKTAIAAYQSFVPAYSELGVQYLKEGALDKAGEALDAALKLSPYDFDANLNFGIVLLQKKSFAEAERALRIASEQRKTAATPHLYLGITLVNLKRVDEAQQELETTIKLPGGNTLGQAHRYLGGIYWSKRDHTRAADELETYLLLAPKAADAERTRAAIKDLRSKP